MAFDGITIAGIVSQLNNTILGGRLYKIAQPEKDELLLTIKSEKGQYRLLASADASLPLLYLTEHNKVGPQVAPNFCMLLRKYIKNAKILSITQPGLERVVVITLEHLDDLGDLCQKQLIIEIMGKHSNIIFADMNGMILDSIKHISGMVSSVRQVLPGKTYFIPEVQNKEDLLTTSYDTLLKQLEESNQPVFKRIYQGYVGISPIMAQEICYRAGIDSDQSSVSLTVGQKNALFSVLEQLKEQIQSTSFSPVMYYKNGFPEEYSVFPLQIFQGFEESKYEDLSQMLEGYYKEKNEIVRSRQRSFDLRKIVSNAYERNIKKLDLQKKQLEDTEKREKYKVWGELIHTYGYGVAPGNKSFEALNYYTGETIQIPLDEKLSIKENAEKYFDKYAKMKRASEALGDLVRETQNTAWYLDSVLTSLDLSMSEEDLNEISDELVDSGYIKKRRRKKGQQRKSRPLHYLSSDGYDIYVGKNNIQNDELTFHVATGNDWWFHAKQMPGSHVIVKSNNEELPDRTFEEAASLAAYYSKGQNSEKVEIDYTQKKFVKKPNGGNLGFVIYHTNYSMIASSDISAINQVKE